MLMCYTIGPLFSHTATAVGKRIYVFGGLTVSNTYTFMSKPDRAEEHEKADDEGPNHFRLQAIIYHDRFPTLCDRVGQG